MMRRTLAAGAIVGLLSCTGAGSGEPAPMSQSGIADCPDLSSAETLPERGCFTVAHGSVPDAAGRPLYWHLLRFEHPEGADAARQAGDVRVEAAGATWLFRFTASREAGGSAETVAVIGPLHVPPADSHHVRVLHSFLDPGAQTAVHVHPGPEAWFVLSGEQCLDTPAGVQRMGAGQSGVAPANTPMRLTITGHELRRAFAVVVHGADQHWTGLAEWEPAIDCADAQTAATP